MPATESPAQRAKPSLTKQASWLLAAKLIGFALSLVAPLIVVRILAQTDFGLYKQVFLVLTTGLQLLTFGFYMNLFYFLPRRPQDGPKIVLNVLIAHAFAGMVGLAVVLAYPQMLERIGSAGLIPYAPVIGIALCLSITGYFLEVVATANQDVGYSAVFIITAQLTKAGAVIAAALISGSLTSILFATIVQGLVQCCALLWYLQKRFPGFLGRPDWTLLAEQLSYAAPFGVAVYATLVRDSFHQFVVASRFSAADYAIYAVAVSNLPLIGLLRESVNSVMIPRVSYLQQQGDTGSIIQLIANATRKLSLVYLPAFVFLVVAASEYIAALYTPRYAASRSIFLINLLALPISLLPLDAVMRAYAEHRMFVLWVRIATTVVLIPGIYVATQWFGMEGAIFPVVLTLLAERILLLWKISHALGVSRRDLPLFHDVGKIAGVSVVAGIFTEIIRRTLAGGHPWPVFAATGAVFCVSCAAGLLLAGVPNADEKDLARRTILQLGRTLRVA
jgi:O-antigen/teichoic acid export membrane protein